MLKRRPGATIVGEGRSGPYEVGKPNRNPCVVVVGGGKVKREIGPTVVAVNASPGVTIEGGLKQNPVGAVVVTLTGAETSPRPEATVAVGASPEANGVVNGNSGRSVVEVGK